MTLKSLERKLSYKEIQYVLFQICSALEYCHSRGIMHRDVKPSNVIIDPVTKFIKLIDWGLSEFYLPNTPFHTRVSSRPFKSPELLLDNKYYDFSMDIWSVGCILAGLVF
jgi:casein kinase II subunit alpha